MSRYDAIIVGGGPAGSTCAWQMIRMGMKPLVLDKAHFPRGKLCAGWITPPVLASLELDPDEYLWKTYGKPLTGWKFRAVEALPPQWFQLVGRVLLSIPQLARKVVIDGFFYITKLRLDSIRHPA